MTTKKTAAAADKPELFITELSISNFKAIRAIRICPKTGEPVVLTGDNAMGKSSIIDSIVQALENSATKNPLRHGAKKGRIVLRLSDGADVEYEVTRRLTTKAEYLDVTDPTGNKMPSPAAFLKSLVGSLAFDPEQFVRQPPAKQAEQLKTALGLDFSELDETRKAAFEERTFLNRKLKEAKTKEDSLRRSPAEDPGKPIDVTATLADRETANNYIAKYNSLVVAVRTERETVAQIEAQIAELTKRMDDHRKVRDAAEADAKALLEEAKSAKETIEKTGELLASASSHNEKVTRFVSWKADHTKARKDIDELEDKSEKLTAQIQEIDETKKRMVSEADMPVEGLTFDETGVRIGETLFSDINTAEQWKIAVRVAMAQNPTLRIVIVKETALMNTEAIKVLTDAAKEHRFQLWMEKFQEEPGAVGLHIVDGSVAFEDGEPIEATDEEEAEEDAPETADEAPETTAAEPQDEFEL